MAKTHPHAEASYRVLSLDDGSFGVEISVPGAYPATVTKFTREADAEAWIAQHQARIQAETGSSRWFRRSGTTTR